MGLEVLGEWLRCWQPRYFEREIRALHSEGVLKCLATTYWWGNVPCLRPASWQEQLLEDIGLAELCALPSCPSSFRKQNPSGHQHWLKRSSVTPAPGLLEVWFLLSSKNSPCSRSTSSMSHLGSHPCLEALCHKAWYRLLGKGTKGWSGSSKWEDTGVIVGEQLEWLFFDMMHLFSKIVRPTRVPGWVSFIAGPVVCSAGELSPRARGTAVVEWEGTDLTWKSNSLLGWSSVVWWVWKQNWKLNPDHLSSVPSFYSEQS